MHNRILCIFALVLFICIAFPSLCLSIIESDTYRITANVFSNGSADTESDSFVNTITVGQPSPLTENLPIQSTNYNHYPGFWYTISAPLSIFSKAYGSVLGDPHYNSECDMDKDDDVDGTDLFRYVTQL
ncbi:MAG: hypothetical protein ACMUIP_04075 [bacterium]